MQTMLDVEIVDTGSALQGASAAAVRQGLPKFLARLVIGMMAGAALLTGCQPAPLIKPDAAEGAIAYVESIRQNSSTSIDALMVKLNPVDRKEMPDFKVWKGWWCPRLPDVRNDDDVRRLVGDYCQTRGGVIDQDVACVARDDHMKVLFFAAIRPGTNCSGTPTARAWVIDPKPGREKSSAYVAALQTFGYRPTPVVVAEMNQAAELERVRIEREMPLLTTRGTRICQKDGGLTFVGFVDDVSTDGKKIRIEVKGTTSGITRGGWQPGATWDQPSNWYVCE